MKRIHSAKWRSKPAQEQRAAEQTVRDAAKQESVEVYKTFSELDLEIVVDVRSFTVSEMSEPVEIVLPEIQPRTEFSETGSLSTLSEDQRPVLVAPALHTHTKLKTPSSSTASAVKRAPVKSKRKLAKPRQTGVFKRFTLLVVEYIKEKFVWARKKPSPVSVDAEHDKRIAENYVFDDLQGIYVLRTEFEKRTKFNNVQKSPQAEFCGDVSGNNETVHFPSRPNREQFDVDKNMDLAPSISSKYINEGINIKSKPFNLRDVK